MVPYFGIIRGISEVTMHNRQRGFTLIEIMVVVVILAVLGALVVPKILENVDKARVTRAQSDIRAIQTALDLYRLDNFKYPTTEQGLQALVKQPVDPTHHQLPLGRLLGVAAEGSVEQSVSICESRAPMAVITKSPATAATASPAAKATTQTSAPRLSSSDSAPHGLPQHAQQGLHAGRDLGGGRDHGHRHLVRGAVDRHHGPRPQLDEESRRIEGLIGLLHERALLEGRDFGLRIEPTRL